MELIESEQEKQQGALTEPEPRYQTAALPVERSEHGHAWVRLAASILIGIVLVVLIVLLARWIYHKAHNHASPSAGTSQTSPAITANNPPASPAPSSSSDSTVSRPSASTPSASNGQITNTGPGDVMAIFVGTSLAAAGLHYLISVRRFARGD